MGFCTALYLSTSLKVFIIPKNSLVEILRCLNRSTTKKDKFASSFSVCTHPISFVLLITLKLKVSCKMKVEEASTLWFRLEKKCFQYLHIRYAISTMLLVPYRIRYAGLFTASLCLVGHFCPLIFTFCIFLQHFLETKSSWSFFSLNFLLLLFFTWSVSLSLLTGQLKALLFKIIVERSLFYSWFCSIWLNYYLFYSFPICITDLLVCLLLKCILFCTIMDYIGFIIPLLYSNS